MLHACCWGSVMSLMSQPSMGSHVGVTARPPGTGKSPPHRESGRAETSLETQVWEPAVEAGDGYGLEKRLQASKENTLCLCRVLCPAQRPRRQGLGGRGSHSWHAVPPARRSLRVVQGQVGVPVSTGTGGPACRAWSGQTRSPRARVPGWGASEPAFDSSTEG